MLFLSTVDYGTHKQPDPANTPGSRSLAVGWTDSAGNLWLLGGSGFDMNGTNGLLDDLWEFNPSLQQWTWMGGANSVPDTGTREPGAYGELRKVSANTTPGGRWGSTAWNDHNGNLWLFGGSGYDSAGSYAHLNDLGLPAARPN